MPRQTRRAPIDIKDVDENYLASVSDLMAGLVFFFIITLAVFAQQQAEQRARLERDIRGSREARNALIIEVRDRLDSLGMQVAIDTTQGVIRLQEAVRFRSGSADLDSVPRLNVRFLAHVLAHVLPRYVQTPDYHALDAVFIEGHTDSVQISAPFPDNLALSSARARSVYLALMRDQTGLATLFNGDGQYVFSATGYGERRPISRESNRTTEGQWANRRIDLRFVMASQGIPEPARAVAGELAK